MLKISKRQSTRASFPCHPYGMQQVARAGGAWPLQPRAAGLCSSSCSP